LAFAQDAPAPPAQTSQSTARPELHARRLPQPPVIDGVLDDDAWREPPYETGEWRSYNPLYGDTLPQQTKVWIGYDANYLYFAFQCLDPQPSAIKTSIT